MQQGARKKGRVDPKEVARKTFEELGIQIPNFRILYYRLKSKQVIELEVTDERTPDCKKAIELVEGVKEKSEKKGKRIKKV